MHTRVHVFSRIFSAAGKSYARARRRTSFKLHRCAFPSRKSIPKYTPWGVLSFIRDVSLIARLGSIRTFLKIAYRYFKIIKTSGLVLAVIS
jgi:hypothetical protein